MAILDVLRFPDERLRTVAAPVEAFTPELQHIVDDMFETMYAEEGIGLAATQVDIHQRIIVIDVSENREEQLVLINPEILEQSGSTGIEEAASPCPATVLWFRAPSGSRSGRKIATATPSSWKRTICSPSAYNMRWIICSASCLWITCPRSSASAFVRSWKRWPVKIAKSSEDPLH